MIKLTKEQNTPIATHRLLENIKPSATKLLLDGAGIDVLDVIKFTFFDLIIKQVLSVKKELRRSHPRDPNLREYSIVETGVKFSGYEADPFESYFVRIIDENSFYHLLGYLKKVYNDLPSNYSCYRYVIKGSKVQQKFHHNLITMIFRWTFLNRRGKRFRKVVRAYLKEIDDTILELLDNEPEKALQLIRSLKGNIFLLKTIKFELFEKLKALSKAVEGNSNTDDDMYDGIFIDYHFDGSIPKIRENVH